MAQYSGGPAEFMTPDDIKYTRRDGWFVSYRKAAIFAPFAVIILIAAGCIGWYINSTPDAEMRSVLTLIDTESDENEGANAHSVSPFLRPLKYRVYLRPVISDNRLTTLKGRVIIEFEIASAARLNKISLNAANITATQYELAWVLNDEEKLQSRERRRCKREDEESQGDDSTRNESITATAVTIVSTESKNETVTTQTSTNESIESSTSAINNSNEISEEAEEHVDDDYSSIPIFAVNDNSSSSNSTKVIAIDEYEIDRRKGLHVIHPSRVLAKGTYFLTIQYEIADPLNVIYATNVGDVSGERWFIATKSKATTAAAAGSRTLFPLFDETHLKAVFSLSLLRHKGMKALSNTPLSNTTNVSDNWVVDTFEDTPLITARDLAFVLGNLQNVAQNSDARTHVAFWTNFGIPTEKLYLTDKVDEIISTFVDLLSSPLPLTKLDLVCSPAKISDAVQSWGLISVGTSLFYSTDRSPALTKLNALKTLIRLFGAQWLGGTANMKSPTDEWIFHGSLIYLQYLTIEKIDPSLAISHSFIPEVRSRGMESDAYSVSKSLRAKVNPHRSDPFNTEERNRKGACLIRMLHGAIGDTAFRNGYKTFFQRWSNESSDSAEFWKAIGEQVKELPEHVTFTQVMDRWTSQRGYPIVTVVRNHEEGSAIVKQESFSYDKLSPQESKLWYVPLTCLSRGEDSSNPRRFWILPDEELQLQGFAKATRENESAWLLCNVNGTGYYRVHYEESNWKLLASGLEEDHEAFAAETRASLIDDVFALAALGYTKYETAFDFIKYMQMKERHYAPWGVFAHHIHKLSIALYETSLYSDLQEFLQKFVSPLYQEMESKLADGSRLAALALQLACLSDHPVCLDWARRSFAELRKDSSFKETVPDYLRGALYCAIAKGGVRHEWNYLRRLAKLATDAEEKSDLLSSFACFQLPSILQTTLSDVLRDGEFDEDEVRIILQSFATNPVASRIAYKFLRENWNDISERFSQSRAIIGYFFAATMNGLTSDEDLRDLRLFWQNNHESVKTFGHIVAILEARTMFTSSWIKNYTSTIEKCLRDNGQRKEDGGKSQKRRTN